MRRSRSPGISPRSGRTDWDRDQNTRTPCGLKYTETLLPAPVCHGCQGSPANVRASARPHNCGNSSARRLAAPSKAMGDSSHVTPRDPKNSVSSRCRRTRSFADGATTFTILFDRKTHLPAAIRTRDDDNGFELQISSSRGLEKRLAGRRSPSLCPIGSVTSMCKTQLPEVTAQSRIAADTFARTRGRFKRRPSLRQRARALSWSCAALSDEVSAVTTLFSQRRRPQAVELAPNVQHVEGGEPQSDHPR